MKISDIFQSDYLKAADLRDRQVTVIIDRVERHQVGKDKEDKPVLFFDGKDKGVILNKTNANTIAAVYGDESDDWKGGEVILFSAPTQNPEGKTVDGIRIKIPPRKPATARPVQQPTQRESAAEIDDDIPF